MDRLGPVAACQLRSARLGLLFGLGSLALQRSPRCLLCHPSIGSTCQVETGAVRLTGQIELPSLSMTLLNRSVCISTNAHSPSRVANSTRRLHAHRLIAERAGERLALGGKMRFAHSHGFLFDGLLLSASSSCFISRRRRTRNGCGLRLPFSQWFTEP